MTAAEGIFWSRIRGRRMKYKFRRQYSIGKYVADFYCPELKLVIEVDGGQHFENEAIEYDLARTKSYNALGIAVVRYTNVDIKRNLISALDDLIRQCDKLENETTSSQPLPY